MWLKTNAIAAATVTGALNITVQIFGDGPAVDRDEGALLARAHGVDGPVRQSFPVPDSPYKMMLSSEDAAMSIIRRSISPIR